MVDDILKKIVMIYKLMDKSPTPIQILGMIMEAEFLTHHNNEIPRSQETLFAILIALIQREDDILKKDKKKNKKA